jgi:hypothetical protein
MALNTSGLVATERPHSESQKVNINSKLCSEQTFNISEIQG